MKFKGSEIEKKFNALWNNEVVPADDALKQAFSPEYGFFQPQEAILKTHVERYFNGIMSIVNLAKECSIERPIASYVNDAIITALKDLGNHKSEAHARKLSSVEALIDECTLSLLTQSPVPLSCNLFKK